MGAPTRQDYCRIVWFCWLSRDTFLRLSCFPWYPEALLGSFRDQECHLLLFPFLPLRSPVTIKAGCSYFRAALSSWGRPSPCTYTPGIYVCCASITQIAWATPKLLVLQHCHRVTPAWTREETTMVHEKKWRRRLRTVNMVRSHFLLISQQ
jgi:hypothetical protein